MSDMDGGEKTSYKSSMPQQLISELTVMRRNLADFVLGPMANCRFEASGEDGKRTKDAYQLAAKSGELVGAWCPIHGWLWFDSVRYPPTERLTDTELRDQRAALARKKGPRETS